MSSMVEVVERDETEFQHGHYMEKHNIVCYIQSYHHQVGSGVCRQGQENRGRMRDEIVSEFGVISVQEAGEMAGLTANYLTRLLRRGRIEGQRVGRAWTVDALSLFTYLVASWSLQYLSGCTARLLEYVTTNFLRHDRFDQAEALLRH